MQKNDRFEQRTTVFAPYLTSCIFAKITYFNSTYNVPTKKSQKWGNDGRGGLGGVSNFTQLCYGVGILCRKKMKSAGR